MFAVGRLAYVACSGQPAAQVALTDDAGSGAQTRLADGTEVEILAWRPRGAGGTRYCVRSTRTGLEGWLAVENLRTTPAAVSAPAGPPPATDSAPASRAESEDPPRRFGQRSR
ncbi:MAG: hypothetical protein L0221_13805 [Chloroflexi bacterium]|nr:hypothetical protein [Chloroflexota bacterium]